MFFSNICFGLIIDKFNNYDLLLDICDFFMIIIKLYIYFCCTNDCDKT